MGEVVELNCVTSLDVPPERVLKAATEAGLQAVVVIGYDAEGGEYFASSLADGAEVVWLMERFKMKLLTMSEV